MPSLPARKLYSISSSPWISAKKSQPTCCVPPGLRSFCTSPTQDLPLTTKYFMTCHQRNFCDTSLLKPCKLHIATDSWNCQSCTCGLAMMHKLRVQGVVPSPCGCGHSRLPGSAQEWGCPIRGSGWLRPHLCASGPAMCRPDSCLAPARTRSMTHDK